MKSHRAAVLSIPLLALAVVASAPACRKKAAVVQSTMAEVRGKVLSANGRALPGARAHLDRESAAGKVEVASAVLGSDGSFVISKLQPGRYLLRTEAPGYATVTVPVELSAGDSLATSLRFEPEQLLEGVVHDGRGRPLPDALVLAWPMGKRQGTLLEARSGADGRFTLAGLPRGSWTLLAEAPGFGTLQLERVEVPSRPLTLRLEGESRSLTGAVVSGNRPVVGAKVMLGSASLRAPRTTVTGKNGTFAFHGVGRGKYTMRASHERLASLPAHQLIDDGTGWLAPYRLSLDTGAFVEGQVLDDTGKPLAGAPVEIIAVPSDDLPDATTADKSGRFSLGPLPPGRYQLIARVPDHVLMQSPEVRLRPDTTPSAQLRLTRAGRLTGRVVDEKGQPVAGVGVTAASAGARARGSDELMVMTGVLPLAAEAAGLPGQSVGRRGKVRTATTDARGRFLLDEMPPGPVRVEIDHPERLPVRREGIELKAGDRQDLGDLLLQAGVVLAGRVLDEAGKPIEGARVEARPRAKGAPVRMASDRDGNFSLRVPGGDYALVALAPARAPESLFAVHAVPGEARKPIELRLPRADGVIEGFVRDLTGKPVSRVNVSVLTVPPGTPPPAGKPWRPRASVELGPKSPGLTLGSAATGWNGKFRLAGLPRGTVILEARHPEWPAQAVTVEVGASVELRLSRPGGIEGEVREKTTGAFVARYQIDVVGPEGRRPDRLEKQGAGFVMMGLQPGPWTIKVSAPGYGPVEKVVDVPSGESRREPSIQGLRIELTREGGGDAGAR
jgi:protocatechuate 3,4-dioxygenase beta subunit